MADCSRPPQTQPALSKNLSSGVFGFRSKGTYDDVFVSRPKMRAPAFTPGVKDYAEIFNCSKPSSIPVLDLDVFEKREDQIDYGNVFGGSFNEARIGASYEEVFSAAVAGDGVGVGARKRTHDSLSQSRGSACHTSVEDGQKLPHESFFEKKHSVSSDKITRGKGDTNEASSVDKFSEVPVSARSFDGAVPPKKASVSRSGATTNNSKQYSNEVALGKHSRTVSRSGLPKHGADISIESDLGSRNGYGSDKSISSDRQMYNDIIRPGVRMSKANDDTDTSLQLGGSVATSNDVYRQNAREEGHGGSNSSSQEDARIHCIHGPDKPFIRDSTKVESLVKNNESRSNPSPDLTHDHGGALFTPEIATWNSSARNSNDNENAKGDSYSYSQDVKFQINNSQVNARDARPHESSKSTTATHSHHSSGKMNIACEGDVIPKTNGSRNVDYESRDSDSNGFLANSSKSKNEVEHVDPAMKKAATLKVDMSKRGTYLFAKDNNSPCSSDDEIDKHSEASVSAAAAKKAIKEAQALIDIAKESNGVKGFMSFVMARNSEQANVVNEEKVKENPKFFEPAKAETQNSFSSNSARQDSTAPWSTDSKMKMAPFDLVDEESKHKGQEFSTFDKPIEIKAVEKQSSLREKNQGRAASQHAPQNVNTFQEKLAIYTTKYEKLAHRKEEGALHGITKDSGQVRLGTEAYCEVVPNVEKRETEVKAAGHEAVLNKNPESYTVTNNTEAENESQKAMDSSDKGFMVHCFHDDVVQMNAGCSANSSGVIQDVVAETEHILTYQNEAIKVESEGYVLPDSASLEEENVEESNLDPHDQVLDCEDTNSANSFEVKQDAVAITEHIHTNQNEAIKVENEGHVSVDSTSLEEENVEESELDPLDQVLDCDDTDSQDYASAEENWVSADSDDEINDKDHHFSAQNNPEEMKNMMVPEVSIITEGVFLPSHNNLHEGEIVEETDNLPLQNILTKEAHVSDEKTASFFHNSDEYPVGVEIDKSKDMPLPNVVTHDTEITSEERTALIFNEDPAVKEVDGNENVALPSMLVHKVKFTSEETAVPFFNYSDEDPVVEADGSENASVLFIVSPSATAISEDGDTSVKAEGTQDMTEQNTVTHEATIISENDIALRFDNSNKGQMVEDNADDAAIKSRASLHNNEHEAATGAAKLHEQTTLTIEKLDCVAGVVTEYASCADHESSHDDGPGVELISTADLSEKSGTDATEESRLAPWTFEPEKQEVAGTNFYNIDPRIQYREKFEQQNDAGVEVDATDDGHETVNVKGFKIDNVSVDAAVKEDATETESTLWDSEPVNHEQEAEVQSSEPLPDLSKHKEATEYECFIQPIERHGRRKWEIPRETFELPELEVGASEIQDAMKQDSTEMERRMDKHERKKWEIHVEKFELPVLGDEVVEENEEHEHVGHDTERATQSAEKPERKKWKIQKEVFEVPILCAEAVHNSPEHEGFVIKTPSAEEMEMTNNLSKTVTFLDEMVQHNEAQNEFSANAEAVPDEAASCELCSENSEEIAKERISEIKMSSEEQYKQLSETSDQRDTKVVEGKAVEQKDCSKGPEEVNVKDEIKRTLGMLWKKIYNVKQDEGVESVELVGKEYVNFKDRIEDRIEKDLNLKGPVELVESPREHDSFEALNFAGSRFGNEENGEASSYSETFEVNGSSTCKSREFVSIETREGQRNSPLKFDSCNHQENETVSSSEEACNENYNANNVESQPEVLSGSGSDDWSEMAPTHEACDLKKEETPKCNVPPEHVNGYRKFDSETVSVLEPLLLDESLVDSADNTEKVKKVPLLPDESLVDSADNTENVKKVFHLNAHDGISDENLSGTLHVDDISDKRCTNNEQQDTSSSRKDIKSVSVSDSNIPNVTPSHEVEQKDGKNKNCPDKIEQARSWKWIFGDDLGDKSNEPHEAPDLKQSREVKAKTGEPTDEINSSLTRNAKINSDKPTSMEDGLPTSIHKEAMPDQDVLKSLSRAKEMERIAVERAIREARERAFIEARERAAMDRANAEARERAAKEKINLESRERISLERANAEARERASVERANADAQKVTSNGQERSQRTSSEAKLASEKKSLEAKRKAELERAAVERATTEARQRALEKAMSRKEQATQSSSSKSTSTSNDQFGSSSKDDKSSESALRFKARNERHQRIAERAAKALAEKNMRDLIVQREQAERNRLAEVLDADVKRWARGKTGNLRALLSTLQYILGPDSGWQAIHLTDIVTADAVKKAYRKATLFVHPDKLQQRGATIRQKYICEKVFDLLKEAWNKFDRDER